MSRPLLLLIILSVSSWACSNSGSADPPDSPAPGASKRSPPVGRIDAPSGPAVSTIPPDAAAEAASSGPCEHVPVNADCSDGWCRIPAGCFLMGSPSSEWGRGKYSETQVQVTLTHDFEIQQLETTQEDWISVGLPNPSGDGEHCSSCMQPNCPVGDLNWFEALAFTNRYSEAHGLKPCYILEDCEGTVGKGKLACANARASAPSLYECEGYRLPTEAEWEYAIRAGTTTALYSGEILPNDGSENCFPDPNIEKIAWYCGLKPRPDRTYPGGLKEPNAWGLYDMAGNAGEWVNDAFDGLGYGEGPLVDPFGNLRVGSDGDVHGVLRGGPVNGFNVFCRSAKRLEMPRSAHAPCFGLRMVRTLPQENHEAGK